MVRHKDVTRDPLIYDVGRDIIRIRVGNRLKNQYFFFLLSFRFGSYSTRKSIDYADCAALVDYGINKPPQIARARVYNTLCICVCVCECNASQW